VGVDIDSCKYRGVPKWRGIARMHYRLGLAPDSSCQSDFAHKIPNSTIDPDGITEKRETVSEGVLAHCFYGNWLGSSAIQVPSHCCSYLWRSCRPRRCRDAILKYRSSAPAPVIPLTWAWHPTVQFSDMATCHCKRITIMMEYVLR